MRVILAGTRSFGVAVFEMLLAEGHEIALVVTPQDDRLADRVLQHRRTNLSTPIIGWSSVMRHDIIEMHRADLIVGAHSHAFVGQKSRAATRLGALGYHPSLLPVHRGKDAVEWTIRQRDRIAGGSVYWFTDNIDGGPIAAQEHVFVGPKDTASSLWADKLFPLGVSLLRTVLHDLDQGRIVRQEQNEKYATWEPSIESPPLYRPELPAIGTIDPMFQVVASRQV
jgi:methionyl-tRNA formyltransferase